MTRKIAANSTWHSLPWALARSVYISNDERAAIKRRINLVFKSGLTEEKSYSSYRTLPRSGNRVAVIQSFAAGGR